MPLYCMCQSKGQPETEYDPHNIYKKKVESTKFPNCLDLATVVLMEPIRCIKTGATQEWEFGGEKLPHIDIYKCLDCGAEIAKEG